MSARPTDRRTAREGDQLLSLLGGAAAALTGGCFAIPSITRSVDFLSTFLRYQAVGAPGALLATVILAIVLHVLRAAPARNLLASLSVMLLAVGIGVVVGHFAGGAGIGALVFGLPTGVVLLGAFAGRRVFAGRRDLSIGIIAVAALLAIFGLVLIIVQ